MKLTNVWNLPQPLYDAVANDPYTKGTAKYSITGLLKPPRQARLQREHDHEIEEDVADRIFSLLGQVIHGILERAEVIGVAEKRLFTKINGVEISGAMDRIVVIDDLLQDYKLTGWWKLRKGCPPDYEAQLNCYRYLLAVNGFKVERLEIVGLLRDWKKSQAKRDPEMPQVQAIICPAKRIWPLEESKAYLEERVRLHELAETILPECSPDDRWNDTIGWAVHKAGSKKPYAIRVYDTELEAQEHVAKFGAGYSYVYRSGEDRRCDGGYCSAAKFCDQWKNILERNAKPPNAVVGDRSALQGKDHENAGSNG